VGAGDTALLEYSLGADRSYGWLVTGGSIQAFELPSRSEMEKAGRRFYDLVSSRDRPPVSELARNQATAAPRIKEAEQLGNRLGAMVLGPVAKEIHGKRLVIVPDGILSYVPFDALGEPGHQGNHYTPLLMGHAISSLPSASVLSVIRAESGNRRPAAKMLVVVADPVFDRSDPRIHTQTRSGDTPAATDSGTRDYAETRASQISSLSRLAYSRREAESISSLIPGARTLLDFSASVNSVTSPDMALYRMVHFATHGFFDSGHPDQSALVLSLVDERGNPRQGFLQVADIFNLNLPAELVVLSACQTALGSDIRGEGLVGLTRAFMYAGATRVVASLWEVDDLATADLMTAFYGKLATGANPVDALRSARLELLKKSAWSSPYYWAGFELQGEFEGSAALRLWR
jgi:CHAT domain-containing protein